MSLPNFLGIGAQRSGTTWLHAMLRSHPDVYVPTQVKEVHFFDDNYSRGLDWYRSHFPASPEDDGYRAVGEITPRYLYDERVPARIQANLPGCRFIAILRHPVDRAYSQYGLAVQRLGERRTFLRYLSEEPDVFARGLYAQQLRRYCSLFGGSRLLVLIFEEAVRDEPGTRRSLAGFLGIDADRFGVGRMPSGKVNASSRSRMPQAYAAAKKMGSWLRRNGLGGIPRFAKSLGFARLFGDRGALPALPPETRRMLSDRYQEDVEALSDLLGRPLDLWKP